MQVDVRNTWNSTDVSVAKRALQIAVSVTARSYEAWNRQVFQINRGSPEFSEIAEIS